jgi:hypothetical protein
MGIKTASARHDRSAPAHIAGGLKVKRRRHQYGLVATAMQPQSFNGILDCLTVWIEHGVFYIH